MATPILEKVSLDLAYKLQDPVVTGTTNGKRVTAAGRLKYITRAYRRLLRIVTLLYPNLITKLFQQYYTQYTINTNNSGILSAVDYAEVHDLFCKEPDADDYNRAEYITPDIYLSVKNGMNEFYTPDLNTSRFYWSLLGGNINLLPTILLSLNFTARPNIATLVENGGYGGADDLDVPTEHTDLLLSLAAAEAYLDLGEGQMVQTFKADALEQIQVLAGVKQEKEAKDETKETI